MVSALISAVLVSNVLVVDPATTGSYPDIQPAITAATDGDTILVKSGSYSGFTISDKSLSLVVDLSNNAVVQSAVHVDNLSAGKSVTLAGFTIQAPGTYVVTATNDIGGLRFQDCNIQGEDGANALPGTSAVRLDHADDVAFTNCQLHGGRGGLGINNWIGGAGGVALSSADSQVALYDCVLGGGDGGNGVFMGSSWMESSWGGTGAHACALLNGIYFASNCLVRGGDGGHGGDGSSSCLGTSPAGGGAGGDGIHASGASPPSPNILLMACSVFGGPGGPPGQPSSSCWGIFYAGPDGVPVVAPTGALQTLTGSARVFNAPRVTRELQAVPIAFHGQPGDAVWVLFARNPDFTPDIPFHGVRLTESSARLVHFGTIGASGTLNTQFVLPDYGSLFPGKTFFLQGLFRDTSNQRFLAAAPVLVELDSIY